MIELLWIVIACLIDSLIALIGIVSLWFSTKQLNKVIKYLVALATGTLLGGAIFHLFAESLEKLNYSMSASFLMLGFVLFFAKFRLYTIGLNLSGIVNTT